MYVVTGGGRGVGRAIVERLLTDGHGVVALDMAPEALDWTDQHPAGARLQVVIGSAGDEAVAERAADLADAADGLAGWVNNAAVFKDASLHSSRVGEVLDLIMANLAPAVAGSATAVRRFISARTPGSIVNVSSHQAQRAVRGALPYATAKAAIEGLTRSMAVDYGPRGIRVNAVALGSVITERYESYLAGQGPEAADRIRADMARLHPLGRIARAEEVASAVAFLLSDESSFINGAVLPVDGGRAAQGHDPEERD